MTKGLSLVAVSFASGLLLQGSAAMAASASRIDALLEAPSNVTAISGRVLTVDGAPLPNVVLTDGEHASATTDAQGRYLLQYVPAGKSVMRIDGRHGGAASAVDYGTYEVQVRAVANRTTALPYTNWLTPIDHANDIVVASPTAGEVVARTLRLPGLEIHIPAGTIITDADGKRINRISLTPVRADRPPFPLPRDTMFGDYFTAQPGGAKLWTASGGRAGATVVYPNRGGGLPGTRTTFWHYHPTTVGWLPYGEATVSPDGKSIVPDEGATIYDFMGGGANSDNGQPNGPQNTTTSAAGQNNQSTAGDPVDLASGLFSRSMTDLTISDVMPISVTRNYLSSDVGYRDFGLGMSLSYEMFPSVMGGSSGTEAAEKYSEFNLVTPTSRVSFANTTPAYGDYSNALFVATNMPGPFLEAQAYWTGNGFEVKRRDGMVYAFGFHTPLTYMQDRFGNRVTLTYQQVAPPAGSPTQVNSQLVQVTSPNGRFVRFTWTDLFPNGKTSSGGDPSPTGTDIYAITKATDNLGRETDYAYDACGRLLTVEDAHAIVMGLAGRTTFAWVNTAPALGTGLCPSVAVGQAPLNLLQSITDSSNYLIVKNDQYEWAGGASGTSGFGACESPAPPAAQLITGRVCHQVVGASSASASSTFAYSYGVDANDNITSTTVTDPRSNVHKVTFQLPGEQGGTAPANTAGYPVQDVYASNDSTNAQTWSYVRDTVTGTLLQVTAPPLTEENETTGRITSFCYDGVTYAGSTAAAPTIRPWNLTSVVRNLTSGGSPCPTAVQTASTTQNATTLFSYSPTYNLVTKISDPNGNTTMFNRGGANNPFEEALSTTDANGNITSFTYAPSGQIQSTSRVATANQTLQTSLTYDHNDLVSTTSVGSDVASRTSTIYTDGVGRPIQGGDPLGDVSTTVYDPIYGPTQTKNANGTAIGANYFGNGLASQRGQPNGIYKYSYNQADLVTVATDPLGAQTQFFYDAASNLTCTIDRRGNQTNFVYDSLNRLSTATYYVGNTSSCSGTPSTVDSTVSYAYDHGNRLLTITDSAGGKVTRQYDDLDRLSSDAQAQAGSGASIGTVGYSYDVGSRMTAVTSTGAPTDSYSYDPANRLLAISRSNGDNVCLTYDQANRRTALVYPAGNTANYSWDSLSDASLIAYTANGSYAPGSGGHPGTCTPGTQTGTGTGNLTYGYDQDGRQIARGGSYFTLLPPSPFAAGLASYNADNQQTMWNGLNNIFDADGDMTCSGSSSSSSCTGSQSQTLSFDARQRLVTASGAPGTGSPESYVYDGLSRRQSLTNVAANIRTTYLYRGLDPVQQNTVNISSGASTYTQLLLLGLGLDERFQSYGSTAAGSGAVITDVQGSTVQLEQGLTTEVSYSYPAFGSTGSASTSSPNKFRYTGREASDNTGLYYYRARYYSPSQSRFIQEDPIGLAAGPNVYAYAGNDPLNWIDPSGLCGSGDDSLLTQEVESIAQSLLGYGLIGLGTVVDAAGVAAAPETVGASLVAEVGGSELIAEGEILAAGRAAGNGTQILVNSAGEASISVQGEELSIHAAQQATTRGISLDDISTALEEGTSFSYYQRGETLTGYYDSSSNTFVGVGNRITTVINPPNPSNYLRNLLSRGP